MSDNEYIRLAKLIKSAPKSVRVGCYNFQIVFTELHEGLVEGFYGKTNMVGTTIYIDPRIRARQLANTFIHEVIHAINFVYGSNDDSTEEQFTNQCANGICSFFQDNPEAVVWFNKLLAEPV